MRHGHVPLVSQHRGRPRRGGRDACLARSAIPDRRQRQTAATARSRCRRSRFQATTSDAKTDARRAMARAASRRRAGAAQGLSRRRRRRRHQLHACERGSITALLGGNGAGKTTTIAMLMGLVVPTSGEARVFGADMARERHKVLHRMNFESPYVDVPMRLTVRQNLEIFAQALRRARPQGAHRRDRRRVQARRPAGSAATASCRPGRRRA